MGVCSPKDNKFSKNQNHQIHQNKKKQNEKITDIKIETEKN